jgi:hypothetical protein
MTSRFEEDTTYDQVAKAIEDSITEINEAAMDKIVKDYPLSEDAALMIVMVAVGRVLCNLIEAMNENGHATKLQSAGLQLYAEGMESMARDQFRSTDEAT